MAFNITLNKQQETDLYESYSPKYCDATKELQRIIDKPITKKFTFEKKQMVFARELILAEKRGCKFRQTDGKIFRVELLGKKALVPIQFQVKGKSITWYVGHPDQKDITTQTFRDEVYKSAAIAHLGVDKHCTKYLRGTNSLHVKLMHTHESEAGMNHNHYRVEDRADVSVKDVAQHIFGFAAAQSELGLLDKQGEEKFLSFKEAKSILESYIKFEAEYNHVGEAKVVEIDGLKVNLPEASQSKKDTYLKDNPNMKLTFLDKYEYVLFKNEQDPCKAIDPELPVVEKLEKIKHAMRGLRSEHANTRQMTNSTLVNNPNVVKNDDVLVTENNQVTTSKMRTVEEKWKLISSAVYLKL